jgi:hypothetical protein
MGMLKETINRLVAAANTSSHLPKETVLIKLVIKFFFLLTWIVQVLPSSVLVRI